MYGNNGRLYGDIKYESNSHKVLSSLEVTLTGNYYCNNQCSSC